MINKYLRRFLMKNSQIVGIFNKFKNNPEMYTQFYHDGCICRTQAICDFVLNDDKLRNENVSFARITPIDDRKKINCNTADFQNKNTHKISWDEHWIPIVYDENKEAVVLDICLMDGPEKLSDYMLNFSNAEIKENEYCNAKDALDYSLFSIANRNRMSLKDITNNPENEKTKIHPNTVPSRWLQDYKKKTREKNKTDTYYLEVKEKLAKKALKDSELTTAPGKTGNSTTGEITPEHKKIAIIQQNTLKKIMREHRNNTY